MMAERFAAAEVLATISEESVFWGKKSCPCCIIGKVQPQIRKTYMSCGTAD